MCLSYTGFSLNAPKIILAFSAGNIFRAIRTSRSICADRVWRDPQVVQRILLIIKNAHGVRRGLTRTLFPKTMPIAEEQNQHQSRTNKKPPPHGSAKTNAEQPNPQATQTTKPQTTQSKSP